MKYLEQCGAPNKHWINVSCYCSLLKKLMQETVNMLLSACSTSMSCLPVFLCTNLWMVSSDTLCLSTSLVQHWHKSQPWPFGASQPPGLIGLVTATCFHLVQWTSHFLLDLPSWMTLSLNKKAGLYLGKVCLRMKLIPRGKQSGEREVKRPLI